MNYDEAKDFLYNVDGRTDKELGDKIDELHMAITDDKIIEGLKLIKEITSCDDNIAKLLWVDVKLDFGTIENNIILRLRERNTKEMEKEYGYFPKYPTCSFVDLERIGFIERFLDISCGTNTDEELGNKFEELYMAITDDNIVEGLKLIKELTSYDDNTAKQLWVDVKLDYGMIDNNPILQARDREKREMENKNSHLPKCPTCGSTHLERVGMFERWLTDYGRKPDTFVCKNCGYKW